MTALPDRVAAAHGRDAGRPVVTFYDQATGERVELSWTTCANWIAKCANLLVDELDVEPGDPVAVDLPLHWQSLVLMLACWQVGAVVHVGAAAADPVRVRFCPAGSADAAPGEQLVVLSLAPMGAPVRGDLPSGALDLARVAPGQPDLLLVPVSVDGRAVALTDATVELTQDDLVPLEPHRALVLVESLTAPVVAELAGVLLAGGSLVVVRNPGDVTDLAVTEKVTAGVGTPPGWSAPAATPG